MIMKEIPKVRYAVIGGSGTWAEADPSTGVSVVYMHNLQPNLEEYHHLRMRATAFGCLNN